MAKVIYIDPKGQQHEFDVGPRRPRLTVGRASRCDAVIVDDTVSRHHCTLSWRGGAYLLEDQRSTSGTMLNGQWIDRAAIHGGDRFQCGEVTLHFVFDDGDVTVAGWSEASSPPPAPSEAWPATLSFLDARGIPQTVALGPTRKTVTIGRLEDCVVRIVDDSVSRHHARVRWVEDHWEVIDLESANGTWLGEVNVERVMLCAGDLLRCGDVEVHFACVEAGRVRRQLSSDSGVRARPSRPVRRAPTSDMSAQPALPMADASGVLPFAPSLIEQDEGPIFGASTPPIPSEPAVHEQLAVAAAELSRTRDQLTQTHTALMAAHEQIVWLQQHIDALQQELAWYRPAPDGTPG